MRTSALTFTVTLRHIGITRPILVLRVRDQDFYAFAPDSKSSGLNRHMSYHASGERHFVSRHRNGKYWCEDKWPLPDGTLETTRKQSSVQLPEPRVLRGAEPLFQGGIFWGEFPKLPAVGSKIVGLVELDSEPAGFRDDYIVVQAHIVEAGNTSCVPLHPDTGPRILHFIKKTTPWIAVEVFQQELPAAIPVAPVSAAG
jgi:hypothetical protein